MNGGSKRIPTHNCRGEKKKKKMDKEYITP
jgi:hypothetical protein